MVILLVPLYYGKYFDIGQMYKGKKNIQFQEEKIKNIGGNALWQAV